MIRRVWAWLLLALVPPQPRPRTAPLLPERTEIVVDPLEPRIVRRADVPEMPDEVSGPIDAAIWQSALIIPLIPADRCDRCSAQAHVRMRRACAEHLLDGIHLVARRLDFCGHHYHEHELALMAAGWLIEHDTRDTLLHRPGASA